MDYSFKEFLNEHKTEIERSKKFAKIESDLNDPTSKIIKKKYRPMKRSGERKTKKDYIKVLSTRGDHDYLKFYSVVKFWASTEYNISVEDIELLFYFYSEPVFTKREFVTYSKATLFKIKNIEDFIKDGLIEEMDGNDKIKTKLNKVYKLSKGGKRKVASIYKKLSMDEGIDQTRKNNKIFIDKGATNKDKNMRQLVIDMNRRRESLMNGDYKHYFEDDILEKQITAKKEEGN